MGKFNVDMDFKSAPKGELALFNAGIYTSNFHRNSTAYNALQDTELGARESNQWFLESYHYIKSGSKIRHIRNDGVKIFLDSGAFSAKTLGVEIDMHAYCDFIVQNMDVVLEFKGVKMIAPLDVIDYGASHGKASYDNYIKMEEMGVHTLPCFHMGDAWEYLDEYMKYSPYVAIGGLSRRDMGKLIYFFDELFERITGSDGKPIIDTHGFSLTSLPLMLKYPWTSVDSSTWVQWAANGLCLLPYSGKQINVSDKSSARKMLDQHFSSVDPITQQYLRNEIEHYGFAPERLMTTYQARWAWNIWAFPYFAATRDKCTSYFRTMKGLFD